MTALKHAFEKCRQQSRAALIPFLTAGYPDNKSFERLVLAVADAGADIIEIGLPFSDPLADGPVIQYSSHQALQRGTTLVGTLETLNKLSSRIDTPLVLMSYYNPIRSFGLERFVRTAVRSGLSGLIIPDMIIEESHQFEHLASEGNLDLIHLLAPTSDARRTAAILGRSCGFVYLVSVTGVTGSRISLPGYLRGWVRSVKTQTDLPVCVGFGISTPELAARVGQFADGVIIGSAIINLIRKTNGRAQAIISCSRFIRKVRKVLETHHG